jgi:hypothetical protein
MSGAPIIENEVKQGDVSVMRSNKSERAKHGAACRPLPIGFARRPLHFLPYGIEVRTVSVVFGASFGIWD